MYPHFVCPNCRTVADLEAELDDPFANGDWEEVPDEMTEEIAPSVDGPAAPPAAQQERAEEPAATNTNGLQQQTSHHTTSDVEPASDSDSHPTGPDGRYVNARNTPSPSSDSPPEESLNATVPAVDIIPRRSISEAQAGFSLLPRPSRAERSTSRTPSPNGISAITDGLPEGPMTPRNDVGPFVFDGSAGRLVPLSEVSTTSSNTDDQSETPVDAQAREST